MPSVHVVLQNVELLEEILGHMAPGKECASIEERWNIASLSRTCRILHISANRVLWARLPSLCPLLQFLPEFDGIYRAYHKETPAHYKGKPCDMYCGMKHVVCMSTIDDDPC